MLADVAADAVADVCAKCDEHTAGDPPAAPVVVSCSDCLLCDAIERTKKPHHGPTSTWNGFGQMVPLRKIDHIFVTERVDVLQHAILADHWDGRWPSDHLPVLAEVELKK